LLVSGADANGRREWDAAGRPAVADGDRDVDDAGQEDDRAGFAALGAVADGAARDMGRAAVDRDDGGGVEADGVAGAGGREPQDASAARSGGDEAVEELYRGVGFGGVRRWALGGG